MALKLAAVCNKALGDMMRPGFVAKAATCVQRALIGSFASYPLILVYSSSSSLHLARFFASHVVIASMFYLSLFETPPPTRGPWNGYNRGTS